MQFIAIGLLALATILSVIVFSIEQRLLLGPGRFAAPG